MKGDFLLRAFLTAEDPDEVKSTVFPLSRNTVSESQHLLVCAHYAKDMTCETSQSNQKVTKWLRRRKGLLSRTVQAAK